MHDLNKFAIIGSRSINNYYLVYTYLKRYLPPTAIIVTGGARGVDMLAEIYASLNGHRCEVYEAKWDLFGKSAGMRRNYDIANNVAHCIAFWDGVSPGTEHAIQVMKQKNVVTVVVDVSEDDIIKPHPGRVVHVNKDPFDIYIGPACESYKTMFANPFTIDACHDRHWVIAAYTDYILKNKDILKELVALKNVKSAIDGGPVKFGCTCAENEYGPICHGDVLCWLLDNVYNTLTDENDVNKVDNQNKPKKSLLTQEEVFSKWNESGAAVQVCTTYDLPIAKGYKGVVQDAYGRWFLEVSDLDIIKTNIHQPFTPVTEDTNTDVKKYLYTSNDRAKTRIIYPLAEFDGSPMKQGCWYIQLPEGIK